MKLPSFPRWPLATLALGLVTSLSAYDELLPPGKVILPAPRSPAESHEAITVAPNLQVELVASEPMVMDPVYVAWGADGKMWVVEMADYPLGVDGRGKPGGRIRYLESTQGDGRYDKMTLFAEDLPYPKSILPWRNGVLIIVAPDILYLEDTNGDGRADKRETWFTGLGQGNQQHRANGLQWGLDGWLTISNGDSGGKVQSVKTGQVLDLGRRDLRIKAEEGLLEAVYGRSQFGRNRDDFGNWFGGNNSNPAWHYALDERYLRRNTVLAPPNASIPVPKFPGQAPVFPTSLTAARFNDNQGFNRFTSACSAMIYRDDLLGPEYAGNLFICEPVHNLINRQIVSPTGVTFSSERAPSEQASEFFASSDNWSRFTSIRTGPDGALYTTDMYRIVIEHPQWIPEAWQKELGDLRNGHDKGRIYRIAPKGRPLRAVARLDRADVAGLVQALQSPNGTVRDLAQQQLIWRDAKAAASAIEKVAAESALPQVRTQALWTLETLGTLSPVATARALKDPDARVRRNAIQLTDRFANTAPELLPAVIALADDPDAAVRQQVAYSLGEWKAPAAGVALARVVAKAEDPLIQAAAMSSALPHAETMITQMNASGGTNRTLIELIIATQNSKAMTELFASIASPRTPGNVAAQFASLADVLGCLSRNNLTLARARSTAEPGLQAAIDGTAPVFDSARSVVRNHAAPLEHRIAATALLGQGTTRQDEDAGTLGDLLAPGTPESLQAAAVRALGQINLPIVPPKLLAGWEKYPPAVRQTVLDVMMSRPPWATQLLDRAAANPTMIGQIDAGHRAALLSYNDGRVAAKAALVLTAVSPIRYKVANDYLDAVKGLHGDSKRGQAVFTAACTACHQLGEAGGRAIGPDLKGLSDRSASYLIPHILDPNRAIEDKYMLYTVVTADGRTQGGLLTAEAGNSLTLVGIDGTEQVILRRNIRSVTSMRRSLMPDGLEASITPQGMADLVAYIASAAGASPPASR
jgi:putative membrane-bound dehydrogenase-like protein